MRHSKENLYNSIAFIGLIFYLSYKGYENLWAFSLLAFCFLNVFLALRMEQTQWDNQQIRDKIHDQTVLLKAYLSNIQQILININNNRKTHPDELNHLDDELTKYFNKTEEERLEIVLKIKEIRDFVKNDQSEKLKKDNKKAT